MLQIITRNGSILSQLFKANKEAMQESTYVQTSWNCLFFQWAHVQKTILTWSLWHINAHFM